MDKINLYIMLFLSIFYVVSFIFLTKIVGKKYDTILFNKKIKLPTNFAITLPNSWGRSLIYSAYILFYREHRNKGSIRSRNFYKQFGSFSFYEHSTRTDVTVSILHLISLFLFFAFILWLIIS